MPFVMISHRPMGSDTFRAPQKTMCNPEPDGRPGPGTTKLAQRSAEAPNPVPGSLTSPLDTMVTSDSRRSNLGRGSALPSPKPIQV